MRTSEALVVLLHLTSALTLATPLLSVATLQELPQRMMKSLESLRIFESAELGYSERLDDSASTATAPDVTLPNLGTLIGSVTTSTNKKRPIYQYLGIPFGQAPVGELRFKAPVAAKPWSEPFNATTWGNDCIQTNLPVFSSDQHTRRRRSVVPEAEQSEDCLNLNVFSPKVDSSAKLPVLVFVYGGAFIVGSTRDLPPNNLLDQDIVLVTPNYRLGPLGFLNLQEEDVPGNAGLLDIVLALQWVKDNIEQFGGDPNKVTLGGESAGAAITSILHLSPLTQGLINAAMPMSGSALDFWAWDRKPEISSAKIASIAGCLDPNTRVACLQKASTQAITTGFLLTAVATLSKAEGVGISGAGPSLQKAGKIVLPDLPENILKSNTFTPVPLMTGVCKHEGTLALGLITTGFITPNNLQTNSTFLRDDLVPTLLKILNVNDPAGFVRDAADGFFFDESTLGNWEAMQDGLIDLSGAFGFKSGMRTYSLFVNQGGQPVYVYTFNHYGPNSHTAQGITHGADQIYIFPDGKTTLEGDDKEMSNIIVNSIANFVTYQNPTPDGVELPSGMPKWEIFSRDSESYMVLDVPSKLLVNFYNQLTVAREERLEENVVSSR